MDIQDAIDFDEQDDVQAPPAKKAKKKKSSGRPLCILCKRNIVNRVFLPCQHAKVCGKCFDKMCSEADKTNRKIVHLTKSGKKKKAPKVRPPCPVRDCGVYIDKAISIHI